MLGLRILAATDLHCVENLYLELAAAVDEHRPDVVALVGDFLDALGSEHKQLTTANCAKALAALPCKNIIFTQGNHEYDNWWEFEGAWATIGRKMRALHGEAFVANPLVAVGFNDARRTQPTGACSVFSSRCVGIRCIPADKELGTAHAWLTAQGCPDSPDARGRRFQ